MAEWVRVATEGDIVEGEAFPAEINGTAIALYRFEGGLFAIGDICSHEHVRLSDGWLDGDRIECPLHQSCFEIRTGKCVEGGPAWQDVDQFSVKVEEGGVFVAARA